MLIENGWNILLDVLNDKLTVKAFNETYEMFWAFTKFHEKDCSLNHRAMLQWILKRSYYKHDPKKKGIEMCYQVCIEDKFYYWFTWFDETVIYLLEKQNFLAENI